MKRFSEREFALLCSPLLITGIVGWLLSRRSSTEEKREFFVRRPTTLEAFRGSQAILVIHDEASFLKKQQFEVGYARSYLKVKTAKGWKKFQKPGEAGGGSWLKDESTVGSDRFVGVNLSGIPLGATRFGFHLTELRPRNQLRRVMVREWDVDRKQIQPFPFARLARLPAIRLSSVQVTGQNGNQVSGRATFELLDPNANSQTPVAMEMSCDPLDLSYGSSGEDLSERERVRDWCVSTPFGGKFNSGDVADSFSGRVSADNRWPLAFQIEPFDFNKVKAGQTLKFK